MPSSRTSGDDERGAATVQLAARRRILAPATQACTGLTIGGIHDAGAVSSAAPDFWC
jgi:hypothetical protein